MIEHINSLSFPDFFPCLMTFSSNVQYKWSSLLLQLLQNILLRSLAAFAKLCFVCNKQFSFICAQSTSGSTSWTCKYFSRLIGYIIKLCLIFSVIYLFFQIDLCPFVAQALAGEGWAEVVDFGASIWPWKCLEHGVSDLEFISWALCSLLPRGNGEIQPL